MLEHSHLSASLITVWLLELHVMRLEVTLVLSQAETLEDARVDKHFVWKMLFWIG